MVGVRLVNFGSFTFLCAVARRGWKNVKVPECAAGRVGSAVRLCLHCLPMLAPCQRVSYNDLHASDGRDTEALNCKPITNL